MNRKRMSERKSELRLDLQDFCMELSENSDPIVGYLLTILEWQASLEIETNSILHKAFVNQIEQIKCKLRMEIKASKGSHRDAELQKVAIAQHIKQFRKLKQVFSYCLTLSKRKSELCSQLQKYNEYVPKDYQFIDDLEEYLNEPIIFETIFHSYLRTYNVNILTADLINFLYAEHQERTYDNPYQIIEEKVGKWSNSDIDLLNSKSIIFKQLADMNKKYIKQEQKFQSSYIHHLCHEIFDGPETVSKQIENEKDEQDANFRDKVTKMSKILNKIKSQPSFVKKTGQSCILLECEPIENLNSLDMSQRFLDGKVIEQNKQFFLETLYGKLWTETVIGDEQFTFMRQKIIKVEALSFLNRILSAVNLISFVYNQLDLEVRPNYEFEFGNLRKLIGSEFINKETFSYKVSYSRNKGIYFVLDDKIKSFNVMDEFNNKILYPSAVNHFFSFLKNMLCTDFSSNEGLLDILLLKSEYLQSFVETITNIFQIIKQKQLSCYKTLREFIVTIIKSSCWNSLSHFKSQQEIMAAVSQEKQKIGIISQIIYEFDHNYSIKDPLEQMIKIQFDGLTRNCDNNFLLYKNILRQIIQIRNGLKLNHIYSVNQIHEIFSLIPSDIQKVDQRTKRKSQDIYFEDIVHEICLASQTNLHIPKLFFFFDLQLKIKRIVFKLQLCWSCYMESMFEKNVQAFKDFINLYCSPIFQTVNQCHNMTEILDKLEEIQRYTELFSREVSRFYLIEKIVKILSQEKTETQIHYLKENMNRLTLTDLEQLSMLLSTFNPIQCQKQSNRQKFIQMFSKKMLKSTNFKLKELQQAQPELLKKKQQLASIIVLLQMLRSRNDPKDHSQIISLYRGLKPLQDLYQRKLFQQSQVQYKEWLNCQNIDELIKYNQQMLVMSILKTRRQIAQESGIQCQDYKQLTKFMNKFQLSKLFNNLHSIDEIQFWKKQLGIMTKYHQIYQLMYHFDTFNNVIYGNSKKTSQYKCRANLNLLNHQVNFNNQRSDFITKLYYISQISQLSRQKVQRNLQALENQIMEVDLLHRSVVHYRTKLKKIIYLLFCQEISNVIEKNLLCQDIDVEFDGKKEISEYVDVLRRMMLNAVSEYKDISKDNVYGKFREVEMFSVKKGYELAIIQAKENKEYKINTKKPLERNKKPMMLPTQPQPGKIAQIEDFKRSFKTEMLKKSLQIRKQISKMQLNENKIRQEIIWETSKLEHSVVEKINQFIALSNVDQQQSYINFKHAVNLETMKGIENVIEEQTQMYMEKKNAALEAIDPMNFFTEILAMTTKQKEKKIDGSINHLDANIDSLLSHMKKIKFFSAWKKSLKKTDMTKKEWCNFNQNVQSILNNDKIVELIQQIQNSRNNYLQQNVTCEIIKQQNLRINDQIQELKINNLQKKVKGYIERISR